MKVSIIVPVYNVSRYLRRCLDSIGRQTFRDFEVIAVDDGSTDDSGRQLDEYEADFPLRRIHQANRGLSEARNAAMAVASGEYLLMVDSDDCIHPRLLELAVEAAERGGLDVVAFDYRRVDDAEVPDVLAAWASDSAGADAERPSSPFFDWFVGGGRWPCAWQFLYRRRSLGDRRFIPGILYEDIPFVLSYLAGDVRGGYLRKELYCYAATQGSITAVKTYRRRMDGYEVGLRTLRTALDERQYRMFVSRAFVAWLRDLWRRVRAIGDAGLRREQQDDFARLMRRLFDGDLVRWGDFDLRWRVRLWLAMLGGGRRR